MIGYSDPITAKGAEIKITTEYIDFNTYKPENIYYISKLGTDKAKQHISIYTSYLAEAGYYDAEKLIGNYACFPDMYEKLTRYDKMLIWMFCNPDREKYDRELDNYLRELNK